jgi:hypothetical protein
LITTLFVIVSFQIQSAPIYQWVDNKGVTHFGDRIPKSEPRGPISQFNKRPIATIELVKAPVLNSSKSNKRKNRKNKTTGKISECQKLQKKLQQISSKLETKLKADLFDQYNQQLIALRWQKIKLC